MPGTSPMASANDGEIGDGDAHRNPVESPRTRGSKQMKMESEQQQNPMLSTTIGAGGPDPRMEPQHALSLGHRLALHTDKEDNIRNQSDDSSELDDEDYAQFSQRRHQAERMLVRELKTLKREKQMIQSIRSLRCERDALLEKERIWERDRLALENEIKKLRQVVDPPTDGDGGGNENVVAPGLVEAAPTPSSPGLTAITTVPTSTRAEERNGPTQHTVARLNHVEWLKFKALPQNVEGESFAIDVLKGEPVVMFDLATYHESRKAKHGSDQVAKTGKTAIAKTYGNQRRLSVVPERIRIQSQSIIKFLENISGEALSESGGPVVMIRPFKFLIYHKWTIHQEFSKLKAKFRADNTAAESATPGQASANAQEQDVSVDSKEEDGTTGSTIAYEQLRCLVEFIDEVRLKTHTLSSDAGERQADTVYFTDIWYLFKPGDEVIDQSRRQVYRVVGVTSGSHNMTLREYHTKPDVSPDEQPFTLRCVYVDFDGKHLGPVMRSFEIPPFDHKRFITSLTVYPLRYAKDAHREMFIARGRMFVEVAGISYMYYSGLTLDTRESVDSYVVIDAEEAFASRRYNSNEWQPKVELDIRQPQLSQSAGNECTASCCHNETICKDGDIDAKRSQEYINSLIPVNRSQWPSVAIYSRLSQNSLSEDSALTDDELVIMNYRVFGFILRSRKWAQLDITYLTHAIWNGSPESNNATRAAKNEEDIEDNKIRTPFEQLVLPRGHKDVVLSLIAQHYRDQAPRMTDAEQVDIIRGKGKGLIILLHGAPGVGKTTTVEGAAELFEKPLLKMTCGDLGTHAAEVEVALETMFALASRWGCIVLLDEADVFLTARSPHDFQHNGLVAVFLRVLEYFTGILFLTTNRIGDFDEAFASRIHMSLRYPQLDLQSTLEIFKLNLRMIRNRFRAKGCELTIDEDDIMLFAQAYWTNNETVRWNGRQIRNGCQTALALAEFDAQGGSHQDVLNADAKVRLQAKHLKTVSRTHLSFTSYLTEAYSNAAEKRAKTYSLRAREWDAKMDDKSLVPHI